MDKLTVIRKLGVILNENARLRRMSDAYGSEFEVLRCDLIEEAGIRRLRDCADNAPDQEIADAAKQILKSYFA